MDALKAYFSTRRGAKADLAKALGLTRAAVCLWRKVPAHHVLDVEKLTGVSRSNLRPDLYPMEAAQ